MGEPCHENIQDGKPSAILFGRVLFVVTTDRCQTHHVAQVSFERF